MKTIFLTFVQILSIPTGFLFPEYLLTLIPVEDGLLHRPRAVWSITYMNCELNDAEMWLKSALQVEDKKEVRPIPFLCRLKFLYYSFFEFLST